MSAPPPEAPALGGREPRGWRQARCAGCGLPARHCVCAGLTSLAVRTRVVVVMHRIEALRSTNTGRLAARVLAGSEVRVRGDRAAPEKAPEGRRLLLFPLEGARVLSADDAPRPGGEALTLVVPDGTWAQARRIARRDPYALGAEAVALPPCAPSAYGLRRNPHEGGLCTLEAIAAAMRVLEGEHTAAEVTRAFDAWRAAAVRVRAGG